jgi:hypothetical protein
LNMAGLMPMSSGMSACGAPCMRQQQQQQPQGASVSGGTCSSGKRQAARAGECTCACALER